MATSALPDLVDPVPAAWERYDDSFAEVAATRSKTATTNVNGLR